MITTIYDKLSLLVKESKETNTKISMSNYDLKCNNKAIYSFDYELTVDEESILDFIYSADNLGFGKDIEALIQYKINVGIQKSLFTKLFIYEKMSELEKDSSFLCTEYVPKLNTGAYDEKPKSVRQLLEIYGGCQLNSDDKFIATINDFKKLEIVRDSNKSDDTAITKIYK